MTAEQQILENENRLIKAMKNADVLTLNELLDDNLNFIIPSGQTITKEMDIQNYLSGNMKVIDIVPNDYTVNVNDNTATVIVKVYLKVTYHKQLIEGNFKYLRLWKNTNNKWKVIAGCSSIIEHN